MQMTNIKIHPHYGDRVTVLPIPSDPNILRKATREQLAVLITVMSEGDFSYLSVAERTGATRTQIEDALVYWQNAGILSVEHTVPSETSAAPNPVQPAEKTLARADQLPHYNTDEAARFLEKNPGTATLIDCCQQEWGKIFNTSESEIIIGLLDYLSLGPEYILLLCAYCARKGKRSLRYMEKVAITLHDAGITDYEQLEIHLQKMEQADAAEAQLRKLFGIGQRALIKREKEAFFRWISEWQMPVEVIERAYEITVSRTKEPSIPYTNAILEKWNADGLRTLEAVEEAESARQMPMPPGTSFDTDEVLELALKRSYQ
ncbi:MAG: DnaD domain protein [Ruminococcaceae bacterium]|nr:DnaD domain protein [Oscillospiraceae bacterium]